jgi:hypothetical protein
MTHAEQCEDNIARTGLDRARQPPIFHHGLHDLGFLPVSRCWWCVDYFWSEKRETEWQISGCQGRSGQDAQGLTGATPEVERESGEGGSSFSTVPGATAGINNPWATPEISFRATASLASFGPVIERVGAAGRSLQRTLRGLQHAQVEMRYRWSSEENDLWGHFHQQNAYIVGL